MIGRKKVDFAKALREANHEAAKRVTEHFNAQTDIFTQCPRCKAHLRGKFEQVTAHECDFSDLIGG